MRTAHRRTRGTVKQVARCQVQRITALLRKFNHVSAHQTRLRWLPAWVDLEKNFWGGGGPSIVGIKVAQFNVLIELQLIYSFNSDFPNTSRVS